MTLLNVSKAMAGIFRCEVSEDAPAFYTEARWASMQIIDLPKETTKD